MPLQRQKSVLITGCSPGGIGYALALQFHAQGLHVFATARNPSTISSLADIGIETLALEVDDPASRQACFDQLKSSLSKTANQKGKRDSDDDDDANNKNDNATTKPLIGLDYLINNAGRNMTTPALDATAPDTLSTFTTNLFSVISLTQLMTPLLLPTRGTIVQIGSIAALLPYTFGSIYNASKAGLHAWSNTLRLELAPLGIHVIVVCTGGVKSNIARYTRTLPEGSIYRRDERIEKTYMARQTHSQQVGMDTDVFAGRVVRGVLGARGYWWNTDVVWEGSWAGTVWFVDSFLPQKVKGWVLGRMFDLSALSK